MFLICYTSILFNGLQADIFKFGPNYLENEEVYKAIEADVLGGGPSDEQSGLVRIRGER